MKEAQRAAKGKSPSGQTTTEEKKESKNVGKETITNEPTKSKAELKAERRAMQV